jgi:acyl-coenzyme A synthetase/AMP-(fatty) acid ligase
VLALATAPAVDDYDLSSLRVGICGAAPLDVQVSERAEERLGCPIRQCYGMTEAYPGTHQVADADVATTPAGSVGRLVPGTEARIVDPAAELEALLLTHPDVLDAAVIGVPHAEGGEAPKAFVVTAHPSSGRRRPDGLGGRAGGAVQEGPRGRVHRRDPRVTLREDLAPAAAPSSATDTR